MVTVDADLPAQLAVARENLNHLQERYRLAAQDLGWARVRESSLRSQLEESQQALSELLDMFTDDSLGPLWVRTPYIPAEDLAVLRRVASRKPPLPQSTEK